MKHPDHPDERDHRAVQAENEGALACCVCDVQVLPRASCHSCHRTLCASCASDERYLCAWCEPDFNPVVMEKARETSKRIGSTVARLRMEHGMSISTLAKRANVTRNTVYSVETGVRGMTLYVAIRVAAALNTTMDDLCR